MSGFSVKTLGKRVIPRAYHPAARHIYSMAKSFLKVVWPSSDYGEPEGMNCVTSRNVRKSTNCRRLPTIGPANTSFRCWSHSVLQMRSMFPPSPVETLSAARA